jgi:hypothetical protein
MGAKGDFSVYFSMRVVKNTGWSLVISRHEEMAELFRRILSASSQAGAGAPARGGGSAEADRLLFQPVRAHGAGLTAALKVYESLKVKKTHLGDGASFADYLDFFGALPEFFSVPKAPPLARLSSKAFVLVLKKEAPFTVQDLPGPKLLGEARRMAMGGYVRQYPAENMPFRQVGSLPYTEELTERSVAYPVLSDAADRKVFFGEFSRWLKERKL